MGAEGRVEPIGGEERRREGGGRGVRIKGSGGSMWGLAGSSRIWV